ncbi:hypothetical protein FRB99_008096 [Tulasnella sp. 403]|nr:hypothetical protein FRB99_008096 [Tulasnella sp. 403]
MGFFKSVFNAFQSLLCGAKPPQEDEKPQAGLQQVIVPIQPISHVVLHEQVYPIQVTPEPAPVPYAAPVPSGPIAVPTTKISYTTGTSYATAVSSSPPAAHQYPPSTSPPRPPRPQQSVSPPKPRPPKPQAVGPSHPHRLSKPIQQRYDDNAINQENPHYKSLRARARQAGDAMARSFRESQDAYHTGNKARAKELSNQGKQQQAEMERLNKEASEWIFKQNNLDSGPDEVDLHGLYVKEAVEQTEKAIAGAKRRGDSQIRLIVGKSSKDLLLVALMD